MKHFSNKINSYLHYGYGITTTDFEWLMANIDVPPVGYLYNPNDAGCVLDLVVDDLLSQKTQNGNCIIPLSGGWDSRIILGAALERFETRKVKTVSFGVPGQLDYDVGRLVANAAGVEHHAVDLTNVELNWIDLVASAKEAPWTYVPDAFFNRYSVRQVACKIDVVLSGFMGDPLTGGHFSNAKTKIEAIEEFINKQRRVKNMDLLPVGFSPGEILPTLPGNPSIQYSELLDFGIRQANCVVSIVSPRKRMHNWGGVMGQMPFTGATVIAPFAHPVWASYWLNAPRSVKQGQSLYLEMMKKKFPRLADLPSKYSFGGQSTKGFWYQVRKNKIRVSNRLHAKFPKLFSPNTGMYNYLDYPEAFRNRDDYQAVLNTAVNFLLKGNITPWLDLQKIREDHQSRRCNYAKALWVLIGLAVNLYEDQDSCKMQKPLG
jgi:hypothetical protein